MRANGRVLTTTALLSACALLAGCFGRADSSADANSISVWMFPQGDDEVAIRAMETAFEEC